MRPRAREAGLVVQELTDETLVYDLERNRAHCLNRTAAMVWRLCDGKATVEEMVARLRAKGHVPVSEDMVFLALERLAKARLLLDRVARPVGARGLSRRELVRGLGAVGKLSVILPLVTSIVAPTAAQAATACTRNQCRLVDNPTCSGCLNAVCSDRPGDTCTIEGGECDCR